MFYHTDTSTHTALCGTKGLKIAMHSISIFENFRAVWPTVDHCCS